MPTVLYVVGANRSGSTLLNTILGAHADIGAFSELCGFPGDWLKDKGCTCGQTARSCPLWCEVHDRWVEAIGHDVEPWAASTPRWERFVAGPRLAWRARRPSQSIRRHLRFTQALFDALAAATGKKVLVDSSKAPSRLAVLARIPDLDLAVVHLVRDPRGVVWSMRKNAASPHNWQNQAPTWKSLAYWSIYNAGAEAALAGVPRSKRLQIRYEDLVRDPESALGSIGDLVGIDLRPLGAQLAVGADIPIQHMLSGNHMRKAKGPIRVREDTGWRKGMRRSEAAALRQVVALQMRRYGY